MLTASSYFSTTPALATRRLRRSTATVRSRNSCSSPRCVGARDDQVAGKVRAEVSRRGVLGAAAFVGITNTNAGPALAALWSSPQKAFVDNVQGALPFDKPWLAGKNKLQIAFEKALAVQDDPVALEAAWSECVAIAPNNASVLGNRGAARLRLKRYSEALEDLEKARDLEVAAFGYSSGLVLLPMGNAKGALGDWEGALNVFEEAQQDPYPGMSSLALESASLAKFQLGRSAEAIETARVALADDPDLKDMQAALAGMLWAVGDKAGAQRCCDLVGGAEILNQFLYSQQVSIGWPPRALAATDAFLNSADSGSAIGYDGLRMTYSF
mmetsp:Transcript_26497/g.50052  ORF Transcript_26497/g.50052 Transcript_26497/m.50052 type:complete len:327 (-) Transcript_26497:158-1138(-)